MADEDQVFLDSISNALQTTDPGAILTKFVVIVDYIDANGNRALWTSAGPDATPWDTLGMMAFATQRELARTVNDERG